jgi:hypothetical protein
MYISRYHTTIYQQQNLPSWHEVEPEFSLTLATSQKGEKIIEGAIFFLIFVLLF